MDFEFDEFDDNKHSQHGNIADILDKVDNLSVDWDNFGEVKNDSQDISKSNVSELFNRSKNSPVNISVSRDFENSRDIDEISMIQSSYKNKSFRFEADDNRNQPLQNDRYQKLQGLLNMAKNNSLDAFYKQLDGNKNLYPEIPTKFTNYQEFKSYTKQLKKQKRQKQISQNEMEQFNPFATNDNNFDNHFMYESAASNNFKKKQPSKNLFASEYAEDDYFKDQGNSNSKKSIQREKQIPDFFPNQSGSQPQFFDMLPPKSNQLGQNDQMKKQSKSQEHGFDEDEGKGGEKLQLLLSNYKNMRNNFEGMLKSIQNTNEGQDKLFDEIRKLKESRIDYETRKQEKMRERQYQKQKQRQLKNERFEEIRQEIGKISNNQNDIFYIKMNEKIQQLQQVVKVALQELNEEKQNKVQPKVINYFCDHATTHQDAYQDNQRARSVEMSQEEYQKPYSAHSQSPEHQKQIKYSRELINSKISGRNQQEHGSSSSSHKLSPVVISKVKNMNDFCSPLDFCFDEERRKQQIPEKMEISFQPPNYASKYVPKELQYKNKNLRNCLTQKSSLVFESFEFHISARFTIVQDPIHPILAVVRVGNKCSIDLVDVHTIVYGPQGPGLQTDPANIFQETVKKGKSYTFNVYVNKQCLEDNGFSLQISYKTQGINKKKVNLKIPLPLVQLIKPQFIYEQQFLENWQLLAQKQNSQYIQPKNLQLNYLRTHEDIKLILPFIELAEDDPNIISYGIMFKYPKTENLFMIKLQCYMNGMASLEMRTDRNSDNKIKQEILDVLNFLFFMPS